jgi:hypothetical protein
VIAAVSAWSFYKATRRRRARNLRPPRRGTRTGEGGRNRRAENHRRTPRPAAGVNPEITLRCPEPRLRFQF